MSGIDSARFNNNRLKENLPKINALLRREFDKSDPIFRGFTFRGIGKRSGRGGRQTASWTENNTRIKELLLRSFPKLRTDPRQHESACRWMLMIYMYWRLGMTHGEIVIMMNSRDFNQGRPESWNLNKVRSLIHRIRRAAELNHRHRGRPHKTV